eukprot:2734244-Karenia_brevis.AAC.1
MQKIDVLQDLARNHDIINLQEVRGSKDIVKTELRNQSTNFKIFHSCCSDSHRGGTTILIKKTFLLGNSAFCRVFVPGRVMK